MKPISILKPAWQKAYEVRRASCLDSGKCARLESEWAQPTQVQILPPALIIMKIEVRLAKASDKKEFLELALERDADLDLSSHYYPSFRKIIGNGSYWNHKFADLVKSRRLLLSFVDKQPAGFLYFTTAFIDYPAAYIELVFVSKSARKLGVARKMFGKTERIVAKLGHKKNIFKHESRQLHLPEDAQEARLQEVRLHRRHRDPDEQGDISVERFDKNKN